MPAYNATWFDPPAPVAYVTICNPGSLASALDVPMLIDTGADMTLLPLEFVRHLNLSVLPNKGYELAGFDGNTSYVNAVEAELSFLGQVFKGPYVLINQKYGILGRNVLKRFSLLLDGPNLAWNEARVV